ncbi:MAG: DNA primase [Candidatus Omnitrophica bacterium]|nr:DNA primase [Candidatus Omnitrophota bacterium]
MGFIPEDVISQVIDRTDIVETIGSYIPLKKAGRNFKALCPFHHEKTSSFVVTPDKQIFHCFGCGIGGNVLTFVMKHERLEFLEALKLLAEKSGIPLPEERHEDRAKDDLRHEVFRMNDEAVAYFEQHLMEGSGPEVEVGRTYLKGRKITSSVAKKFRLGYAPDSWDGLISHLKYKGFSPAFIEKSGLVVSREENKGFYDRFRGRVIFSIFDVRGRALAFGARALKKDDKAKYINSPETPVYTKGVHLYGLNWSKEAVGREDMVVVVEGYMDFIRPFNAGFEPIAASLGTALTVDQIRLIRRYTRNVVMLYDMDKAGQMAILRSLDLLLAEDMNVRVAALADGEDPDSFVLQYGIEPFRAAVAQAKSLFEFKLERLLLVHDAKTIEGRARICQEMLPTIDKVPSEEAKSGYLRELSGRLGVSETALLKEAEKRSNKAASRVIHEEPAAPVLEEKALHSDEGTLIRLLLNEPRFVAAAHSRLQVDDIKDARFKSIVRMAFELFEKETDMTPAILVSRLEGEGLGNLVTMAASEPLPATDQQRVFEDCVGRICDRRRREERKILREAIRKAEAAGDRQKVLTLQTEFNQLIKG